MKHIRAIISIMVSAVLVTALLLWNVLLADNQGDGIADEASTAASAQANRSVDNLPARPVKTMVIGGNSQGACRTTYPGTLKPSMTAKMAFRVGGPLVEVKIKPGDTVRKGDVLMRIDPRDYENQVAATNAALQAAQAELAAMEKGAREEDIHALEAGLEAANAKFKYAKQQHERHAQLVEDNVVTQAQFDAIVSELNVAASSVRSVEAQLAKAKAGARAEDILAKKAAIEGLNTQLKIAKDKLEDTFLRAHFNGIITCQNVENFEQVSPGQVVLGMQDVSKLEIEVNLPEKEILHRSFATPFTVDVHFEAASGRTFPAAYKEINTDANAATRTYAVTFEMPAPSDLHILPGMTAEVSMDSCSSGTQPCKAGIFVPSTAVFSDSSRQTFVWVVGGKDQTAQRRKITTGRLTESNCYEVLSGLQGRDQIVTAGVNFIHSGMKLRIVK